MDSRGGRFEAAAVEIFRPGGSAGFPGFFLERSLEGLVVPREVRGRWALLRLIPSSPPTQAPSTLRHPAAYERPPNTLSLSLTPLSLLLLPFPLSLPVMLFICSRVSA